MTIVYCNCDSTQPAIYKRLWRNPLKPELGKRILPSYICPNCRNHRPLWRNCDMPEQDK